MSKRGIVPDLNIMSFFHEKYVHPKPTLPLHFEAPTCLRTWEYKIQSRSPMEVVAFFTHQQGDVLLFPNCNYLNTPQVSELYKETEYSPSILSRDNHQT